MNVKIVTAAIVSFGIVALSSLPASARDAILRANSEDSRIDLRSTPSESSPSRGFGLPRDRVQIIGRPRTGTNGNPWYYVQSYRSGMEGWVDEAFVQPIVQPLPAIGSDLAAQSMTATSRENRHLIDHYEVRIFFSGGATRLNVFDRRTNRTVLNGVPVTVRKSADGVTYQDREDRRVVLFLHNNGEKTITIN